MQSFGSERQVQQGEDWNLDILLSASDKEYIPYIISSQRTNPFFVTTIASTKFEKNLRYIKSFWSKINDIDNTKDSYAPKFFQTIPVYCGELEYVDPNADFKVLKALPLRPNEGEFSEYTKGDTSERRYLYQYIRANDEIDYEIGHKPYHYFYFEYQEDGSVERVDDYECRLRFNFKSEVTSEWAGQSYLYQITLVSGPLLEDRLHEIYRTKKSEGLITDKDWPKTIELQYKFVKANWPNELQKDIDVDSPLGRILQPEVILPPTKLEVFNNLRTII